MAAAPWIVSDELWELVEPLLPRKERRFRWCTRGSREKTVVSNQSDPLTQNGHIRNDTRDVWRRILNLKISSICGKKRVRRRRRLAGLAISKDSRSGLASIRERDRPPASQGNNREQAKVDCRAGQATSYE